jgi:hypothetical protein
MRICLVCIRGRMVLRREGSIVMGLVMLERGSTRGGGRATYPTNPPTLSRAMWHRGGKLCKSRRQPERYMDLENCADGSVQ